jgi:hypothetical protein
MAHRPAIPPFRDQNPPNGIESEQSLPIEWGFNFVSEEGIYSGARDRLKVVSNRQ